MIMSETLIPEDLRSAYEKVQTRGDVLSKQMETRQFLGYVTNCDRSDARKYGDYLASIISLTPGLRIKKNPLIPPLTAELEQYWTETVEHGTAPRVHRCFEQQYDRIPLALVHGVSLIQHGSDFYRQKISNDQDECYWVCDIHVSDDPAFSPGKEYRRATPAEAACIFAEFPQFGSLRGVCKDKDDSSMESLQVFFTSDTWDSSQHTDVHEGHLIAESSDPVLDWERRNEPYVRGNHHMVWIRNIDGRKAPPTHAEKM